MKLKQHTDDDAEWPIPEDGESKSDFMDRCIANLQDYVEDDPSFDAEQACQEQWDAYGGEESYTPTKSIIHKRAKPVDEQQLEYILSDGSVDRMGDIIEPGGWKLGNFRRNPIALFNHNSDFIIGEWKNLRIEKDSLRGQLILAEENTSPRVREVRRLIEQGILRGVSVGFKPIKHEPIDKDNDNPWMGGRRFMEQELIETSVVAIPANQNALRIAKSLNISDETMKMVFRQAERPKRAALNMKQIKSVVVKMTEKSVMAKKSIAEQISAFEATRAAKAARMEEVMLASGDKGETLDTTGQEEYDGLEREVKSLDEHLNRLRALEKINLAGAREVKGTTVEDASASRGGGIVPRIVVRAPKPLEKGINFARYVMTLARAQGNVVQAYEIAKANEQWQTECPEVADVLKAAVAVGNTTDPAWAGPLVNYQILTNEFIELLRPATIIGRIPGLTRVPFKIKVPAQTGGASVGWVGEGAAKPVSALAFSSIVLDIAKIAGIVALTDELVRLSTPSAELLVRNDLAAAIVQFMDGQFVDPAKAATAASPASITNGISGLPPTGADQAALKADVATLMAGFVAGNLSMSSAVWIMTQQQAMRIGLMQNPLGQATYPGIDVNGGTLGGIPVVASENLPAKGGVPANGYPMILALASDILLADDGQVTIDASREASLQMDSAPDSPPTATTVLVSLWQNNMVGIKAERYINWKRRRNTSVAWIDGAKYA